MNINERCTININKSKRCKLNAENKNKGNHTTSSFNLKFICTSDYFKKYQNCMSQKLAQNEFFQKFTSSNKFQIEREKSYDFQLKLSYPNQKRRTLLSCDEKKFF